MSVILTLPSERQAWSSKFQNSLGSIARRCLQLKLTTLYTWPQLRYSKTFPLARLNYYFGELQVLLSKDVLFPISDQNPHFFLCYYNPQVNRRGGGESLTLEPGVLAFNLSPREAETDRRGSL